MVNKSVDALQRGLAALRRVIGEENALALLQPAPKQADEAFSFYFPLPIDHAGQERRLRISFPPDFPRRGLRLQVLPSPWLIWPHAMESGLCLHGFQERPVTGSPEFVVQDSFDRLAKILLFSVMGSSKAARDAEFQREITSYWSGQLSRSSQNLILLDRPRCASSLLALSDPRQICPSGQETVWLATETAVLSRHYQHTVGRSSSIRAAETPGFYVKLQSHPDIRIPAPEHLLPWLGPHLNAGDLEQLSSWYEARGSLTDRWIAMELPGDINAPIYCLNIRSRGTRPDRGTSFNHRTARRRPATAVSRVPTLLRATTIDVLDRSEILSRDLSGVTRTLENSRVVCVGVGSLGGAVALQLARSGVGHLTLIDYDTLVSANLGRHVLGVDDLGKQKAKALRKRIIRDLPTVEVTAYATFAETVMSKHPDVFEKADLVVITTADWQSEDTFWGAKLNGTAWGLLQAWSEPHTQVGHTLFAPSGASDARYLFKENGDFLYKFTEWPDGGIVALPACGESFIPGGSLGMMNIASMVAQAALGGLTGRLNTKTWISSINRPQDVAALGGKYVGPALPDEMPQALLERGWPEQ